MVKKLRVTALLTCLTLILNFSFMTVNAKTMDTKNGTQIKTLNVTNYENIH